MRPHGYVSGDYAGIKAKHACFYYGYEITGPDDEWCFVATMSDDTEIVVPWSELKSGASQFDCVANLLQGIAWVMQKYKLQTLTEGGE